MPWTNAHLAWLHNTGLTINTSCGKVVSIFEFQHDSSNENVMRAWAKHFRNHYCLDEQIEILKPKHISKSHYLIGTKFPDRLKKPGPSIRAGDFAEILVADYLEFMRSYYVPRTRYDRKVIGNESTKGSDVLAFKSHDSQSPSPADELLIYEVKARLSENSKSNILKKAINDSSKDEVRLGESLNAVKQRLLDKNDFSGVSYVERYQYNVDHPYKLSFGAAAVVTKTSFHQSVLSKSDTSAHVSRDNLELIAITGEQLMSLVHLLYDRAANEA